ncbi:hypothetical protein HYH03_007547 [Edaphochlamys debaryana]|uniref:Uncharacterized protein n=1 Tax=Edaphochlamys debaryana TaxID=47281 RepID=A0A835Y2T6_9CHLO|nr:hypothetical protein HYH03_007547 [Edaphochlamys debaryana]|eukprot:KAG2494189.1 hypothetical protein HYH03_007547 [Edaphochlamys debaryana]
MGALSVHCPAPPFRRPCGRGALLIAAALGGVASGAKRRRRSLIKRRDLPSGAKRLKKRRYRDEPNAGPSGPDSGSGGLDPQSPKFPGRLTSEINAANGPLRLAVLLTDYGTRFSGTQATMALARLASFAAFLALAPEQAAAQARATRRCVLLLRQRLAAARAAPGPGLGTGVGAGLGPSGTTLAPVGGGQAGPGTGLGFGTVDLAALGPATGAGPDLDLTSLARASYALGRLGVYDAEVMDLIAADAYDKMNLMTPDALAALAAGFGALGHAPPQGWLQRLCLEVYTRFSHFTAPELASLLYTLARLRHPPSPAWTQRCLEAFRAATSPALPATPPLPPAMVKFAFALATLQIRPSFNWTTAFVARCRPHLDALSARELAVLLWALSRLLTPAPPPPQAGLAPSASGAPAPPTSASPAGASDSAPAAAVEAAAATLAAAAAAPGAAAAAGLDRSFLEGWLRCSARRMPAASPAALVLALQALAVMQVHPLPPRFLVALLEQLQGAMEAQAGGGRGEGVDGAAGAAGPLPATREQAAAAAGSLSGAEGVSVLLSLAALRLRPGEQWLETCLAALEPQLGSMPGPLLCDLLWALARLRYQPSPAWLRACASRLAALGPGLAAPQLRGVGWALRELRVRPPAALRGRIEAAEAGAAAVEAAAEEGDVDGPAKGEAGGQQGGQEGSAGRQGGAAAQQAALQARVADLLMGQG